MRQGIPEASRKNGSGAAGRAQAASFRRGLPLRFILGITDGVHGEVIDGGFVLRATLLARTA